jgi:hypothetical protein
MTDSLALPGTDMPGINRWMDALLGTAKLCLMHQKTLLPSAVFLKDDQQLGVVGMVYDNEKDREALYAQLCERARSIEADCLVLCHADMLAGLLRVEAFGKDICVGRELKFWRKGNEIEFGFAVMTRPSSFPVPHWWKEDT